MFCHFFSADRSLPLFPRRRLIPRRSAAYRPRATARRGRRRRISPFLSSEICPAVVPWATADEESGSSLRLGSCVDQPFVLLGTRKLVLEMLVFK